MSVTGAARTAGQSLAGLADEALRKIAATEDGLFSIAVSRVNDLIDAGYASSKNVPDDVLPARVTRRAIDALKALDDLASAGRVAGFSAKAFAGIRQAHEAVSEIGFKSLESPSRSNLQRALRDLSHEARAPLVLAKDELPAHAELSRRSDKAYAAYQAAEAARAADAGVTHKTVKLPADLDPHASVPPKAAADPAPHWGRLSKEDNDAAVRSGF